MTGRIAALCLLVCLTECLGLVEPHDPQKRLLMTGTENLQQQYHSLQLEIQEMKTKYSQQESTVTQLDAKLRILSTEIQTQKNKNDIQENTIQSLRSRIQNQETTINQLSNKGSQESGSVYIRWGKKTCSNNATIVYSGFAAGTGYTETGSSAKSICLPKDPIWSVPEPSTHNGASNLYGTEYEFDLSAQHLQDNDMPCAVCMSKPHSEVLMIPGRNRCYSNWNEEYHGYLIGPRYNHAAEDFLCLDGNPETITGGYPDNDGHVFYLVRTKCGSLECPPYQDNKVVTCVVCSK